MTTYIRCDRCCTTVIFDPSGVPIPRGWFDVKGLPTEYSRKQLCPVCVEAFLGWIDGQSPAKPADPASGSPE